MTKFIPISNTKQIFSNGEKTRFGKLVYNTDHASVKFQPSKKVFTIPKKKKFSHSASSSVHLSTCPFVRE